MERKDKESTGWGQRAKLLKKASLIVIVVQRNRRCPQPDL